ncbi:serine/threonine protein kinase [Thermococcus sp. CX2]|nr:serine/threonine protein kinase [Thermococcus sp. CX2]
MKDILRKSLIVDIPKKLHAGEESYMTVGFRNGTLGMINVEVDLENLGKYFDISPTRVYFQSIRPGEYVSRTVKIVPRKIGKVDAKVIVRSGLVSAKVKVTTNVFERPERKEAPAEVPTPAQTPAHHGSSSLLEALFSRYRKVEPIGEGGFARVYRAEKMDGTVVAIKVPISLTEEGGKAFLKEVRNWSLLTHPNIVELYDYNIFPVPYLEMEYCETSLAKVEKPMSIEKATKIIFDVCEGLKYAHSKGIVHRDLKPSNILLKNGKAKISDWGLSKLLKDSKTTLAISFTPLYAAPEQISGKFGTTDERTDVWQVGAVLYELVTGRPPFLGEDFVEIASKITLEEVIPPSQINPDAEALEPIILKCLQKEKDKRYQSIEELQQDLAKILGFNYKENLNKSISVRDFSRSAYYAGELFLLYLKLGDLVNSIKYAEDLAYYAKGDVKEELSKLKEQLKLRLENNLDVPPELIEKAEIIVHKIKLGFKEA